MLIFNNNDMPITELQDLMCDALGIDFPSDQEVWVEARKSKEQPNLENVLIDLASTWIHNELLFRDNFEIENMHWNSDGASSSITITTTEKTFLLTGNDKAEWNEIINIFKELPSERE